MTENNDWFVSTYLRRINCIIIGTTKEQIISISMLSGISVTVIPLIHYFIDHIISTCFYIYAFNNVYWLQMFLHKSLIVIFIRKCWYKTIPLNINSKYVGKLCDSKPKKFV